MLPTILATILSVVIGALLGLFGGGGSILALPMLVWVAGYAAGEAVPLSLAIVGGTSAIAAVRHGQDAHIDRRVLLRFGPTSMLGAIAGARLTSMVSGTILLLAVAVLMIVVGMMMLRERSARQAELTARSRSPIMLLAIGLGVGVLTGFLGVGGGFLIVPVLSMWLGLPMHVAVGTSLVIIAASAAAGLGSHLASGIPDLGRGALFTAAAIGGALAGESLSERVRPENLRTAFAAFVIAVGVAVAGAIAAGAKPPSS